MSHVIFERGSDFFAVAALASWINPSLHDWLSNTSEIAGLITPAIALLWLIIQIVKTVVPWLVSVASGEHKGDR